MTLSISKEAFGVIIAASFVVAVSYQIGHRRNLKLAKRFSSLLETYLSPHDQNYTWLGGVMGFTADFNIKGFREVKIVYRLVPRQSLIWLPLVLLTGGRDTVQVLFYIETPVAQEFHLVRKRFMSNPKIYNLEKLRGASVKLSGVSYRLLFERETTLLEELREALGDKLTKVQHLAITPDHSIFYLSLEVKPSRQEETVAFIKEMRDTIPTLKEI